MFVKFISLKILSTKSKVLKGLKKLHVFKMTFYNYFKGEEEIKEFYGKILSWSGTKSRGFGVVLV